MKRRQFLKLLGVGGVGAAAATVAWHWPDQGLWHPCHAQGVPEDLLTHELYQQIWHGLDTSLVWDSHVHIVGTGDSGSGLWLSPKMQSPFYPLHYVRYKFYMNAACAEGEAGMDNAYLQRLLQLHQDFPRGSKLMLLALDYHHDERGKIVKDKSPFHVPNAHAAHLTEKYPQVFEWIASVHPYRDDVIEALNQAKANGARAVKWIPPVMGGDPASGRCDAFYDQLVKLKLPLLTHSGDEHAVAGVESHASANPLLLRSALDRGVKVIMAHSACEGHNIDIDKGNKGPKVANFELFSRMMDEPAYRDLLYGDISALTQINHMGVPLETLVQRQEWHSRLLNGSDYPLPAVMPMFSMDKMVRQRYLSRTEADYLSRLREYNPLLFDFGLKRLLKVNGKQFSATIFESARLFSATV